MVDHCIIHIGTHKTGSTSIQETLFRELLDPAFEYAKMGRANHTRFFHNVFSTNPENSRRENVLSSDPENSRREFERAIREAAAPTIIFSGEGISKLQENELGRMREFFERRVSKISVVGYVRAPWGYMQSAYQERIKARLIGLKFKRMYSPYRPKLEKFDRVFGQDRVHLWKFAPNEFPGGDAVRHFFDSLGINVPNRLRRINDSISKPVVQALYAYHKYESTPGNARLTSRQKNNLVTILSEVKGDKFRFSAEVVKPVLEANRDDIEWIEQRMGAKLTEPVGIDEGAIRNEDDMLRIDAEAIASLEALVRVRAGLPERQSDPAKYAAKLVRTLLECAEPVRRKVEIYPGPTRGANANA